MIDKKLITEVENAFGKALRTAADYEELSNSVFKRLHQRLSPTTIKRIWGYINEDVQPRVTSLDLLARFTGYRNYEVLVANEGEPQSNEIFSNKLSCKGLAKGARVCITWKPNKRCVVMHEGDGLFRIKEAQNTKLCVGDTFRCNLMIENEPLYVDNLIHLGAAPVCYVAGKKDGIMFEVQK